MKQKSKIEQDKGLENPNHLEPGQFKPKNEGINNTDIPGVPSYKKAKNNPTHQDEGLSGGGTDPLAEII